MNAEYQDDYRDDRLTQEQIAERSAVWHDTDLRACEDCGREWTEAEIGDPTWFVDTILTPDENGFDSEFSAISQIRCPSCW